MGDPTVGHVHKPGQIAYSIQEKRVVLIDLVSSTCISYTNKFIIVHYYRFTRWILSSNTIGQFMV